MNFVVLLDPSRLIFRFWEKINFLNWSFFTKSAIFDWTVLDLFDLRAPKNTWPHRQESIISVWEIPVFPCCSLVFSYQHMKRLWNWNTLKHIVQKGKCQQSSTFFWGGCAFFTFLCHEIIDKSVVCYIWFEHTSLR